MKSTEPDAHPPCLTTLPVGARMEGDALFGSRGRYRYGLTRRWRPGGETVLFVLLNPSTADARQDDPTIRRCIGFARRWGFAALEVANLFAYRATHPADLRRAERPIGPRNDAHLRAAARRAARVVVAWGFQGHLHGRAAAVCDLLLEEVGALSCLGTTQGGHPRHVLYLRGDSTLRPYPPRDMRPDA